MATPIREIEGIGPKYASQLEAIGIHTVEELLAKGFYPKGRQQIETKTQIDRKRILDWIGMADLFRVNGVGKQFAELLKAAGVDTVKELKMRNAINLQAVLVATNEAKNLCKATPSTIQVANWIKQAKHLEARLTY